MCVVCVVKCVQHIRYTADVMISVALKPSTSPLDHFYLRDRFWGVGVQTEQAYSSLRGQVLGMPDSLYVGLMFSGFFKKILWSC